jgi:hypothetical protein
MILNLLCLAALSSAQVVEIPEGYDKYLRPSINATGDPHADPELVEFSMEIADIFKVEMLGIINLRLRIMESWYDSRLDTYHDKSDTYRVRCPTDSVWIPKGRLRHAYDIQSEESEVYLMKNGRLIGTQFINVEIYCEFDFTWLPFDW